MDKPHDAKTTCRVGALLSSSIDYYLKNLRKYKTRVVVGGPDMLPL
jgi:hypothetical protein